jgi:hypothetical protein
LEPPNQVGVSIRVAQILADQHQTGSRVALNEPEISSPSQGEMEEVPPVLSELHDVAGSRGVVLPPMVGRACFDSGDPFVIERR